MYNPMRDPVVRRQRNALIASAVYARIGLWLLIGSLLYAAGMCVLSLASSSTVRQPMTTAVRQVITPIAGNSATSQQPNVASVLGYGRRSELQPCIQSAKPYEHQYWVFQGTGGDRVTITLLTTRDDYYTLRIVLHDPHGAQVAWQGVDGHGLLRGISLNSVTLSTSGSYIVYTMFDCRAVTYEVSVSKSE